MADGSSTITLPIPPEALARLRNAERRQRKETLDRGLTAVPVSVEGLCLLQMKEGKILCGCGCGLPLDFEAKYDPKDTPEGYPIIAHVLARGSRGEHTPLNVQIHRDACNKRDASADTSGAASVKRFTPDMQRRLLATPEKRDPKTWQTSGKIPRPKVSQLSKAYRDEVKKKMAKRAQAKDQQP